MLGLGTWHMAEDARRRDDELDALRVGLDLGLALVDTAEMYGDGDAEELVGEAIRGRRDDVFVVSKVLPQNAGRDATIRACEASLRRLGTDRLDLYLLHWRGRVPLDETLSAFDALHRAGKIRYWGVSNFDVDDMEELADAGATEMPPPAANQVLYNMMRRGIEFDLIPWISKAGIPIMAYSPLEQGALSGNKAASAIARTLNATPSQVALAWVLRQPGVMAIPKSGSADRVRENHGALQITLTQAQMADIDRAFPPPSRKKPLEMI